MNNFLGYESLKDFLNNVIDFSYFHHSTFYLLWIPLSYIMWIDETTQLLFGSSGVFILSLFIVTVTDCVTGIYISYEKGIPFSFSKLLRAFIKFFILLLMLTTLHSFAHSEVNAYGEVNAFSAIHTSYRALITIHLVGGVFKNMNIIFKNQFKPVVEILQKIVKK